MNLKKYQQRAIEKLTNFLRDLDKFGLKAAYVINSENPYKSEFFEEVPFICMKLPTGAGKTLVGCHSIKEIMNTVLKNKLDKGLVLWFTPSEAIKSQTLRKFRDKRDIHRMSLDEAFENKIKIFSNEDALRIRKEDIENNLCIIVASLEAFRKDKKIQNKYKVYQENGSLMNHFDNIESNDLEKDENGTIINSLANVIKLNSPLIVIDEGHKTKTKLSIEFLKNLNPSFIIEYTATPRPESNVLVQTKSSELKEEEMVKIPIVLESSSQWQNTINRGFLQRQQLEILAKKNKEYIRPIALLQAEQDKESKNKITVNQLKEFLIKEKKVPEEEIAIKISGKNELEGVDLFSKKCPIRYIITVNALAEGWDCSFAYVLISVANIGSKVAVEQIIGRILRMPNAKRKEIEELNRSYVFTSAKNFNEAANQIIKGLEDNGYSRKDLISYSEKGKPTEFEVKRKFKEDFYAPLIFLDKEPLSFENLLGEDFEISKQDYKFEFKPHFDSDGKILIDIEKDDKWSKEVQQTLNLNYKDKNFSEDELVQWFDKKLRYPYLEKQDKIEFIKKVVKHQLKEFHLSDLSVNRYILAEKLSEIISSLIENYTKEKFDRSLKKGILKISKGKKFSDKIEMREEINQVFKKNYYEKVDGLNKEELRFIERLDLDTLPNIKFWIRNREKKDPFYLQGWRKNKFYPDFIAMTQNGKIVALEWKGEDRESNDDTKYKEGIGKIWEKLDNRLSFSLVTNKNVDEVLKKIGKL